MDNKAIASRLDEAGLRIETLIYLAGEAFDSRGTDAFQEFLADQGTAELQAMFGGGLPIEDDEEVPSDEFLFILQDRGTLGFLVNFATPVRSFHSDTSFSWSWGHYRTNWFYADSIDEAIAKGLAWAGQMYEHDRKKAAV